MQHACHAGCITKQILEATLCLRVPPQFNVIKRQEGLFPRITGRLKGVRLEICTRPCESEVAKIRKATHCTAGGVRAGGGKSARRRRRPGGCRGAGSEQRRQGWRGVGVQWRRCRGPALDGERRGVGGGAPAYFPRGELGPA